VQSFDFTVALKKKLQHWTLQEPLHLCCPCFSTDGSQTKGNYSEYKFIWWLDIFPDSCLWNR